jgi:hypothetical protein
MYKNKYKVNKNKIELASSIYNVKEGHVNLQQ